MGILGTLVVAPPKPATTTFLQKSPPSKFHIIIAAAKGPFSNNRRMTTTTPHIFQQQSSPKALLMGTTAAGISCFIISSLVGIVGIVGPSNAADLIEPSNALSLPTWSIHVSSVIEWVTAMSLVWQYGGKSSGLQSWKGLSWGMVPLLGGALCACTWHFFYNSESLEALVVLQAALTVIGNATMCVAAYRIYMSSQKRSNNS